MMMTPKRLDDLLIFSGRSNLPLASNICNELSIPLGQITTTDFSDGETFVQLNESVRGKDVFFIQSTNSPASHNLMELLIMMDAARRSSAERITAVIPYFGYGRQDRKDRPRVPITAKLVANMITQAGADRVLSVDMHTGQLQGFFDIPVDHITSIPYFVKFLRQADLFNPVIVSPDAGGSERASTYANHLGISLAIIDKRRDRTTNNKSEAHHIIGDVVNKTAIIVDDMIDTAGTLGNSARLLKQGGAKDIYAIATHGVFSGNAYQNIYNAPITRVFVTDTINWIHSYNSVAVKGHSIAPLLAEAIYRIHIGESVSSLIDVDPICGGQGSANINL